MQRAKNTLNDFITVINIFCSCYGWNINKRQCSFIFYDFFTQVCKMPGFLADFGLSKIIGPEVQMQTVCGTPGYCGEYC